MENLYLILSYGGLALAVIFAIVAVIIFFKLDIRRAIGDMTGSTARKQIAEIREKGYESVQGAGASKKDAIKDKDSTGRISVRDAQGTIAVPEKTVAVQEEPDYESATNVLSEDDATDILEENSYESDAESATDILTDEDGYESATDVLSTEEDYEGATDVLSTEEDYEGATDVLSTEDAYEGATDVLSTEEDYEGATDVLAAGSTEYASGAGIRKLYDIVVVHTDESI
jgi:hypothetical protein